MLLVILFIVLILILVSLASREFYLYKNMSDTQLLKNSLWGTGLGYSLLALLFIIIVIWMLTNNNSQYVFSISKLSK
jgi:hypothetical protein